MIVIVAVTDEPRRRDDVSVTATLDVGTPAAVANADWMDGIAAVACVASTPVSVTTAVTMLLAPVVVVVAGAGVVVVVVAAAAVEVVVVVVG